MILPDAHHKHYERNITIVIFLLLLLVRAPFLANSPAEYHGWRQSDTEAIAENFLTARFNLFYPQLNYDGPLPNYVQLELQLTTFIIALLYKLFGVHLALARIVPLAFFAGSAYYILKIAKWFYGIKTAWFALLLYGLYPFNIFISRAILPESAALFFYLGALYYLLCWKAAAKTSCYLISAVFAAGAVLEKIPAALILLPLFYLLTTRSDHYLGHDIKNTPDGAPLRTPVITAVKLCAFYVFIALGLPVLYYTFTQTVAETAYVRGIAIQQIWPHFTRAVFTLEAWSFFLDALPRVFTVTGLGLFFTGLFTVRKKKEIVLLVWALAIALEFALIVAVIRLDYYLIFAGPLLALLGAKPLRSLSSHAPGKIIAFFLLFLILVRAWWDIPIYYNQNTLLLKQAETVQELSGPQDLIVIGSPDPELLNLSRRTGWRANLFFPGQPEKEIAFFIEKGAKYFVPVEGSISGNNGGLYLQYLKEHFANISPEPGFPIFKLAE